MPDDIRMEVVRALANLVVWDAAYSLVISDRGIDL
jgi:hypothetical protein